MTTRLPTKITVLLFFLGLVATATVVGLSMNFGGGCGTDQSSTFGVQGNRHVIRRPSSSFVLATTIDNNYDDIHHDASLHSPRRLFFKQAVVGASMGLVSIGAVLDPALAAEDPNNDMPSQLKRNVRYVLDDESGEYVEVDEPTWQEAWRSRWKEASTMSQDEIFQAARGAGNVQKKDLLGESTASKKRRALSACRSTVLRERARAGTERDCTARVLGGGKVDFLLEVL